MKTKLKALVGLSLLILFTFSFTLVVLAGTAKENDSLHSNKEVGLTPGGIGLLATTINVTQTIDGLNNGDGFCSLREAIEAANTDAPVDGGACPAGGSGNDIIILDPGTYFVTHANGDLDITSTLTIQGAGAGSTIIDDNVFQRIFDIASTGVVTISDVTITAGDGSRGGAIRNEGVLLLTDSIVSDSETNNNGGGILNDGRSFRIGDLTVINSIITNNTAQISGGGIFNEDGTVTINNSQISNNTSITTSTTGFGGGVANTTDGASATMTINQSTISNNTANGAGGGGLVNLNGTMRLVNSTVSGNTATSGSGLGGGIINTSTASAATLWLTNTTITNNAAVIGTGVANAEGPSFDATIYFKNSILGDGCANPNPAGQLISNGYNMENGNTCNLNDPPDFTNTDPMLGSLQNNGGDTETHALSASSPAIDAGTCTDAPTTDQRGQTRPNAISAFCDIGAYEADSLGTVDLEITKTVNQSQPGPGQTINYTLTFSNDGPAGASSVAITDVVPVTLTNVTSSSTGVALTPTPGVTFSWTVGDLSRGAGGTIIIRGQISSSVAFGETFTNTAVITGINPDSDTDSNRSQVSVTVTEIGLTNYLPIILKNSSP